MSCPYTCLCIYIRTRRYIYTYVHICMYVRTRNDSWPIGKTEMLDSANSQGIPDNPRTESSELEYMHHITYLESKESRLANPVWIVFCSLRFFMKPSLYRLNNINVGHSNMSSACWYLYPRIVCALTPSSSSTCSIIDEETSVHDSHTWL